MPRNRTRLPWSRGATQAADASFFDRDPWRGPRPDSPEVSVFTPEEEAESHKRWKRAALRERFSGPVSDAERLGFGLSAAALAALAVPEGEADADADGEAEARWREDPEGAGEVFAALKSASLGQAANKPPVPAKPAGAAAPGFLDTDEDGAFSNPVSSRSDNGFGTRRAAAPRGGGAPLEGRSGGGAERVEVTVLRKAEQATGDARAPLPAESAASAAAIRGPATADAQAVTMAIAMASELPEARGDRPQAEAKAASGAARANQAQAPVDAAPAKPKDAPPAAEAKADGRQGSAIEAAVREKAGDAPSPAVGAKAAAADAGRGAGAADAPGRAKANDAASDAAAATEAVSDRKGSAAAEAPVEAKAKDVAPTAEAEGGLGQKAAKPLAQAKAAEVVVLETKSTGPEKGATNAHGATKAKDTQVVVEAKAEAVRQIVETPEQTAAKAMPDVAGAGDVHVNGSVLASAINQAKAASAAVDKAAPATTAHAPAEAAAQAAKAAAAVVAPAAADKAAPAAAHAPAEAAAQANKAEAANATAAEKSGAAHAPAETAAQATKAAVLPAAAADKAAPAAAHGPAEATAQAAKALDAPVAVGAEKVAAAKGEAALQSTISKDAEKSGAAHAPTEASGQATKAEATNATAADKAAPAAAHGPAEAAAPAAKAAALAVAPAATADKAAPAAPHVSAEVAKAADAPPAVGAEKAAVAKDAGTMGAKADPGHGTAAAPGQAKDTVPSTAPQTDAGRDHAEAPGQAKAAEVVTGAKAVQVPGAPVETPTNQANAKDAPAAGAKPDPSPASAEAPAHTAPKDALPAVADTAKAGAGLGVPEAAKQGAKAADTIPAVAESKGAQDLGGHAEAPAVLAKVKDVAADAPAPAQHQAEPPSSAKSAPVAVTAVIVPEAHKAEQAVHVADTGAPKAEQAAPPAEQPNHQAKLADPPPAQAHDTAQHGDATAGAVPAVSPTADTIDLHVTGLWPGTGQQPGQGQNNVPLSEKAAQPVPHAADIAGANGEHGTSTVASADEGSSGGAAAAVSPSLVTGEKNAAAMTSTVAPDGAKGTGDASPTQKAAATEPAGTDKHVAAIKPPGETAGSVVSDTVAKLEKTSGHGLTEAEAFALLSAAHPKAADAGHDGLTAGDILVQGHSELNVSALDTAWHHHFMTHDAVLL